MRRSTPTASSGCSSNKKTLPNLWTICPPFQIDASLGVVAGVAEMLLQSNEGVIEVLPALPEAWRGGHFDGLVARGNFKVAAKWTDAQVTELRIHSRSGNRCRLQLPDGLKPSELSLQDSEGRAVSFDIETGNQIAFSTEQGGRYRLASD